MYKKFSIQVCLLSFISSLLIFIPFNIFAASFDYNGQLKAGAGYMNQSYLNNLFNDFKDKTTSNGYFISDVDGLGDSGLVTYTSLDFQTKVKIFSIGISTGFITSYNNNTFKYKAASTDTEFATFDYNTFIFPQCVTVSYKYKLLDTASLNFGLGSGYYLIYNKWSTDIKTGFDNINDGSQFLHRVGVNAKAEISFLYNRNFSFEIGVQAHYIIVDKDQMYSLNIYGGITEYTD